ncbi:MAG: hypothetical protein WAQ52_08745 [Terriglobales bacterium]
MILSAHCTDAAINLSVSGLPVGAPNKSPAVRMCMAVRIAAMMPMTRLRPSSHLLHNIAFALCSPAVYSLQRPLMQRWGKVIVLVFTFLLLPSRGRGTTIIAKVTNQRIILAADTRQGFIIGESVRPNPKDNKEDGCKIIVLKSVGFGALGHPDYHPTDIRDTIEEWNAYDDARQTYDLHPRDIRAMAEEWGKLAAKHYASFYSWKKDKVIAIARDNKLNLLLRGVFAGWNTKGQAELIFMDITLDGTYIAHKANFMPARTRPYSANDITKLLIESSENEAKGARKKWTVRSKTFPLKERDWRELEFLVQTTSDYDPEVGKEVDVLELTRAGASWLQNKTCH